MDGLIAFHTLPVERLPIHEFVNKIGLLFPLVVRPYITLLQLRPPELEPGFDFDDVENEGAAMCSSLQSALMLTCMLMTMFMTRTRT